MPIRRIAVLITSFNRREFTLNSLASLLRQRKEERVHFSVFLVDDGSTDGTGEAVRFEFPDVRLLQGDGTLFWNGGMRMAFGAALREPFDAYLFLNDDVILYENALERVIECAQTWLDKGRPAIVVGSMRCPLTGEHSYGGVVRRAKGFQVKFEKVAHDPLASVICDTMNGNCALIPNQIASVVGNIEACFRHQFGDLDYGLRAKRAGFDIVVAPGYIGECLPNSRIGTWRDPSIAFRKRWKHLISLKGVPFKEWLLFTWRHYGWRGAYYIFSPYLKTIVSSLMVRRSMCSLSDSFSPKS